MKLAHRRFVAPVSFGLGDLVVSLPVVQSAVAGGGCSDSETWLVARSTSQAALAERVSGLAGTVVEGDAAIDPEALIDLRDHPLQRDYWWGSSEFAAVYGSLSINQIIAQIGADLGVIGDFSAPAPLESRSRPDVEGLVLFVADADGTAKRWAPAQWVELAAMLGRRGLSVAVVTRGEDGNTLVEHGLAGVAAATPGDAVDVLSACRGSRRGRYRSDPYRSSAGDTHGHPFPDTGGLLPGLGPHPPGRRVSVRSGVPACGEGVRLQPARRPENHAPGASCLCSECGLPGSDRAQHGLEGVERALLMDSHPLSKVVNSQPAGIGRLVSLDNRCAWNNLGRNIVFADTSLRPLAIFGDTMFPDDDEASQFDLDVHAIVEDAGTRKITVVNHLGSVRIFELPRSVEPGLVVQPHLEAERRIDFLDDVERVVVLGDRLITSRPRGQRLDGVLVTERIASADRCLDASTAHESFGFVTALAAKSTPSGTGWVALGGQGRVRLIEADGGRLGATRWEAPVGFLSAVLVASGSSLWAAGSNLGGTGVDDYDWEQLGEGALSSSISPLVPSCHPHGFGDDLAWGSGGVALVVADGIPCGVGRCGELHALAPGADVTARLTNGLAPDPLGIAHAAVVGNQLVIGFNRGGYRLHTMPLQTVSQLVRGLRTRTV